MPTNDDKELHYQNIDNTEKLKYMYEYLRDLKDKEGNKILSPEHVAGILGNFYQESKFNPEATSGAYQGLAQMSPQLYAFYNTWLNNNNFKNTLENQLTYLGEIITNRTNANPFNIPNQNIFINEWGGFGRQDKFITTPYKTAGDAAIAFADLFERQGANDNDKRKAWADYIAQTYNYKSGGTLKRLPIGKSGIHINPKNKGKFTKASKAAGETPLQHAHKIMKDPNATALQRKRANFVINANKWKK